MNIDSEHEQGYFGEGMGWDKPARLQSGQMIRVVEAPDFWAADHNTIVTHAKPKLLVRKSEVPELQMSTGIDTGTWYQILSAEDAGLCWILHIYKLGVAGGYYA